MQRNTSSKVDASCWQRILNYRMAGVLCTTQVITAPIPVLAEITKFAVKELIYRITTLEINKRLRGELCKRAEQLQGVLQKVEKTASGTDDESTLKMLQEVKHTLDKCLETCDQIGKRSLKGKFWNVRSDNMKEKELESLLAYSLQITTTHLVAKTYSTIADLENNLRDLEKVTRNTQGGIYPLDGTVQTEPEKMEQPAVNEKKPGVLHIRWPQVNADSYELQFNQQIIKLNATEYLLDTKKYFPGKSLLFYKLRVRGVNGRGPGEWSECTVGKITILPKKPRKPLAALVNSPTSVTLVVEKPAKQEHVKPVTHFVVGYHSNKETRLTKKVFSINQLEEVEDAVKIDLSWCVDNVSMYNVEVCHRNEDGDSLPCEDTIRVDRIPPGEPVGLTVVYTTTHTIIIEWSEPETSGYVLDHYEVQWERNGDSTETKKTKKCYAVFRNLETYSQYFFKVRAVNKNGYESAYIEISAETRSMAKRKYNAFLRYHLLQEEYVMQIITSSMTFSKLQKNFRQFRRILFSFDDSDDEELASYLLLYPD